MHSLGGDDVTLTFLNRPIDVPCAHWMRKLVSDNGSG